MKKLKNDGHRKIGQKWKKSLECVSTISLSLSQSLFSFFLPTSFTLLASFLSLLAFPKKLIGGTATAPDAAVAAQEGVHFTAFFFRLLK